MNCDNNYVRVVQEVEPQMNKKVLALVGLLGGVGMLAAFTRGDAQTSTLMPGFQPPIGACTNSMGIGEISIRHGGCLNINGENGKYNVVTGKDDVVTGFCDNSNGNIRLILCGDGSIRNTENNTCFTKNGANLVKAECDHTPTGLNPDQKFKKVASETFVDDGGITQNTFELIHEKSNQCIGWSEVMFGKRNDQLSACQKLPTQQFFFEDKGKVVDFGHLVNKKSGLCLGLPDTGLGDIKTGPGVVPCDSPNASKFLYYENGQIFEKKTRHCVTTPYDMGSGDVITQACRVSSGQRWTKGVKKGDYFPIHNNYIQRTRPGRTPLKIDECMTVGGTTGKGVVNLFYCDDAEDQQLWKFDGAMVF